jgi:hypothetical protein
VVGGLDGPLIRPTTSRFTLVTLVVAAALLAAPAAAANEGTTRAGRLRRRAPFGFLRFRKGYQAGAGAGISRPNSCEKRSISRRRSACS